MKWFWESGFVALHSPRFRPWLMDGSTEWIYPFFQVVAVLDSKHPNSDLVLSQFPSATDTSRLGTDTSHLRVDTNRKKADTGHVRTNTSQQKADTCRLGTDTSP